MRQPKAVLARPLIVISRSDAERLTRLAEDMEHASPQAANMLLDEIERARVVPDHKMPADVVRMHSTVRFLDEAHGQERTVSLVYPQEADIEAGRISVLTPIGAGLLGLRADQAIAWPDREGHERALKVLAVEPAKT
jgi:regulator of nucleoside diphosphate kinase